MRFDHLHRAFVTTDQRASVDKIRRGKADASDATDDAAKRQSREASERREQIATAECQRAVR